jgi:uncharacterized membrane protein YdjX (TVP38/TMEM64 family)
MSLNVVYTLSYYMNRKFLLRATLLIVLIAAAAGIYLSPFGQRLSLDSLIENRDQLLDFIADNYLVAVLIYMILYIIVIALSLPGGAVMTLAGGALFGYVGLIYVNLSATLGATGAFLSSRFIVGSWVQEKFGDKLNSFNENFKKDGVNYLIAMRFIPAIPFFLQNLLPGLTKTSIFTFMWTTSVGTLIPSAVFVFAGTELARVDNVREIVSPGVIGAFVALALLSLLPVVLKKLSKKKS